MRVIVAIAVVLMAGLLAQRGEAQSRPLDVIAYRPYGKLVLLRVAVDGGAPAWFCFDSGAHHTIIDPRLARSMNLKALSGDKLQGTGKGDVAFRHAAPVVLTIGSQKLPVADPWLVDLSATPIEKDVLGLIGADLMTRYVVRVDPISHTLALFDPRTFAPSGETPLPLVAKDNRFFVDATLEVSKGLTRSDRFRIDTGSEDAIDDPVGAKALRTQKTSLGNGLGANFEGLSAEYPSVTLGPYTWRNVWGAVTPSPFIGMEILHRFVVTFDVPHGRLYLRPTPALNDPVPQPK